MTNCKFRIDNKCQLCKHLLSKISINEEVECKDDAFKACTECKCPHTYNHVVGSLTYSYLHKKGLKETAIHNELIELIRPGKDCINYGPGTELKKLLSYINILPDNKDSCGCELHAHQMNLLGVDGCRKQIKTIIGWMKEASIKFGWKWEWDERIMATLILFSCQLAEGQNWFNIIAKFPLTIISTIKYTKKEDTKKEDTKKEEAPVV